LLASFSVIRLNCWVLKIWFFPAVQSAKLKGAYHMQFDFSIPYKVYTGGIRLIFAIKNFGSNVCIL
jgi:hypothetical protein